MYSYADRIRAVELYIKLSMRVRRTIRQLGYPTKNSLKGWYNKFQLKLDLSAGYAGREPKFSQAQKAAAVEHYHHPQPMHRGHNEGPGLPRSRNPDQVAS